LEEIERSACVWGCPRREKKQGKAKNREKRHLRHGGKRVFALETWLERVIGSKNETSRGCVEMEEQRQDRGGVKFVEKEMLWLKWNGSGKKYHKNTIQTSMERLKRQTRGEYGRQQEGAAGHNRWNTEKKRLKVHLVGRVGICGFKTRGGGTSVRGWGKGKIY